MSDEKQNKYAPNKRSKVDIARDRARIADLFCRGWSQFRIAKELGLHRRTVQRDIEATIAEWLQAAIDYVEKDRLVQLERIRRIEESAWDAFEASKVKKKTKKKFAVKRSTDGSEQAVPVGGEQSEETVPGDSTFLNIALECVRERGKLLGQYKLNIAIEGDALNRAKEIDATTGSAIDVNHAARLLEEKFLAGESLADGC